MHDWLGYVAIGLIGVIAVSFSLLLLAMAWSIVTT